jgi:hypothetical protein
MDGAKYYHIRATSPCIIEIKIGALIYETSDCELGMEIPSYCKPQYLIYKIIQ